MSDTTWITLSDGKSFSRLLYPNPVCFLGTLHHKKNADDDDQASTILLPNVMVLSWLTATNNDGRFVFAISCRRFTADILKRYFTLSVPVRGMEDLVLNVGAVSGKVVNKFPPPPPSSLDSPSTTLEQPPDSAKVDLSSLSRRKKRKLLAERGVPGLYREPFLFFTSTTGNVESLFAIRGTVAQMACEIVETLHTDDEHIVYQARVVAARVDANYWDTDKLLFRPMTTSTAPYLTFFGSQTFGYVCP
jgi:flavin reductase (DIM6/NTAB) family NADH-FMN oxidoreductase RutF